MRLRPVLFRLHWALGLTAGLVLALMGVTGALMSYEEAIQDLIDADRASVSVTERPRLTPDALVARLAEQRPGLKVGALVVSGDPSRAPRARFAAEVGLRPASVHLDPYDGAIRGEVRAEQAFATIRALHRWLLLPGEGKGWGRTLTGACTLALLFFLASGLYLRWPQIHRWRVWLKPHWARPGRARWWSLHAVVGTWLIPAYAFLALTGLWWSYDAYRIGATWLLTGTVPEAKPARKGGEGKGDASPPALDKAWAAFEAAVGRDAALATLTLPGSEGAAIRIRWIGADRPGGRNEMTFDRATGAVLTVKRDAGKPFGQRLADNMLEVHRGRLFGAPVALLLCLTSLALPLFAGTGLALYALRRRAVRRHAVRSDRTGGALPRRPVEGMIPSKSPSS